MLKYFPLYVLIKSQHRQKEDSKEVFSLVVLGVGGQGGGGIETPAPLCLLCNTFLAPRKYEKKKN